MEILIAAWQDAEQCTLPAGIKKHAGDVSMNANCEQKSILTVQKNKITVAAGMCIINKGVSGSSMKEIQDASGMGRGRFTATLEVK
ncbi:hypothetical protein EGD00_08030 [Pectobacterium carotovorum subsp. carotovorum]|nr:hypothetical protein EGD00_08030 [Pectobacterium carotovorum subsp. carotovorum]